MSEHWGRPVRCVNYSFAISFNPLPALPTNEQLDSLTYTSKFGNKSIGTTRIEQ
jgi:hypothetical protein